MKYLVKGLSYQGGLKLFGPPTTKKRPRKMYAKLNGNHLLMNNIFKFHEYQRSGVMKIHNMCKI